MLNDVGERRYWVGKSTKQAASFKNSLIADPLHQNPLKSELTYQLTRYRNR